MNNNDFNNTLKDFIKVCKVYHTSGTSSAYGTYLRAIQHTIEKENESLLDWIVDAIKKYRSELSIAQKNLKDAENSINSQMNLVKCEDELETALNNTPLERVLDNFDSKCTEIKSKTGTEYGISDCRSALSCFAKYIIGTYKADIYMGLNRLSDKEACKQIAKNALFCKVQIANDVNDGKKGYGENKFYSWFKCEFQRKSINQQKGQRLNINGNWVTLDDNTKANLAIKYAILAGLPNWLSLSYRDFEDYMACHVWDNTCYNYKYHTSVFNIVLLPKSIGGLTDYNYAVKHLLQYESAMRFGVYPEEYNSISFDKPPKYYNDVDKLWRQPQEHQKAKDRIDQKQSPRAL